MIDFKGENGANLSIKILRLIVDSKGFDSKVKSLIIKGEQASYWYTLDTLFIQADQRDREQASPVFGSTFDIQFFSVWSYIWLCLYAAISPI